MSTYLTRHGDLLVVLLPHRALCSIRVVEHDRHAGLCDSCLATLVDEVLLVRSAHLPPNTRLTSNMIQRIS